MQNTDMDVFKQWMEAIIRRTTKAALGEISRQSEYLEQIYVCFPSVNGLGFAPWVPYLEKWYTEREVLGEPKTCWNIMYDPHISIQTYIYAVTHCHVSAAHKRAWATCVRTSTHARHEIYLTPKHYRETIRYKELIIIIMKIIIIIILIIIIIVKTNNNNYNNNNNYIVRSQSLISKLQIILDILSHIEQGRIATVVILSCALCGHMYSLHWTIHS